jgi:hypothetical protein
MPIFAAIPLETAGVERVSVVAGRTVAVSAPAVEG